VIDGATYLVSAFLLWLVKGTWQVSATNEPSSHKFPCGQSKVTTVDAVAYLRSAPFGALVLLKASGALVNGASDVLYVSISERREDTQHSTESIGILFAAAGVGCVLGPLVANLWTNTKRLEALQAGCVASFGLVVLAYVGMSSRQPYWAICVFTGIRAAGDNIIWLYSTLLVQKLSTIGMLGRVSALEYGLATLAEAASAFVTGVVMDTFGLSPEEVSISLAVIATVLLVVWYLYHCCVSTKGIGGKQMYDPVLSDDSSRTVSTRRLRSRRRGIGGKFVHT
jgi:predicted MFS family arabinose efflux permease